MILVMDWKEWSMILFSVKDRKDISSEPRRYWQKKRELSLHRVRLCVSVLAVALCAIICFLEIHRKTEVLLYHKDAAVN